MLRVNVALGGICPFHIHTGACALSQDVECVSHCESPTKRPESHEHRGEKTAISPEKVSLLPVCMGVPVRCREGQALAHHRALFLDGWKRLSGGTSASQAPCRGH